MYTLSKEMFVDKYQLTQLAQFETGGIAALRGVWGETDLEDPAYKMKGWGSIVLVDIPDHTESSLTLELPLHLRYLEPVDGGGKTHVDIQGCRKVPGHLRNSINFTRRHPFLPAAL
jgi:PIG-X / PBN1